MEMSITKKELSCMFAKQINFFFPDGNEVDPRWLGPYLDTALEKLAFCFSHSCHSRYFVNGQPKYYHLYSDHNIVLIWMLSNVVWKDAKDSAVASKLYYLNKSLHGFDCMYDTGLPDIFLIFHGVGTMLGKAVYSDYFVALQGCTIGSDKGHYPEMGKYVSLTANSSIIGKCKVEDYVTISTHSILMNENAFEKETVYFDRANGGIKKKIASVPYALQFFK